MKFVSIDNALRVAITCLCIAATTLAYAQTVNWSDGSVINHYYADDNVQVDDTAPYIVSDGLGNWLAIWTVSNRSQIEDGAIIKVARSNDPADHWDPPVIVDDSTTSTYPRAELLFAGNNTWIAYWDDYYSRSTDGGATWSPRESIVSFYSLRKKLDSNSSGTVIAIYILSGPENNTAWIKRSTDYGETWSAPTAFDPGPTWPSPNLWSASISCGGGDKWYIALTALASLGGGPGGSNNGLVYLSTDNGITWTPKSEIPNSINSLEAVNDTVVFRSDSAIDEPYGTDTHVFTSLDAGATFTDHDFNLPRVGESDFALAHDSSGNWCFFNSLGDSEKLNLWTSLDALNWTPIADNSTDTMFSAARNYYSISGGYTNQFVVGYFGKDYGISPDHNDFDIVTRSSSNGGASWTYPIHLNEDFDTDTAKVFDSDINIEYGNGTMIANWSDGTTNHMISRSFDQGQTWSGTHILDRNAIDRPGTSVGSKYNKPIHAGGSNWYIYRTDDCQNCDIGRRNLVGFNSYDSGTSWTQLPLITGDTIAGNGSGLLMKSMSVNSGRETEISISTDLGTSWNVQSTIPLERVESLVHFSGTTWLARNSDDEMVRLNNNGATWTSQGTAAALVPYKVNSITSDHNGKLVATCDLTTYPLQVIYLYASVSNDCGANWSTPELVYTESTPLETYETYGATAEALHVGGENWIFVSSIEASKSGSIGFDFFRVFSDSQIVLARSIDGGRSWNVTPPAYHFDRINGADNTGVLGPPSFCLAGNKVAVARAEKNVNGSDSDLVLRTTNTPAALAAARDWQLFD